MMTSQLQLKPLAKNELADYGLAQVRDAAFEAFLQMWRYRQADGWTQKRLAQNIGRDKATVSKYFRGPANWTMRTLGELVQGLEADVRIIIEPLEESNSDGSNYDAYDEFDWNAAQIEDLPIAPKPGATEDQAFSISESK
jgi:transcriptional regulator with XRE-family HTH domain